MKVKIPKLPRSAKFKRKLERDKIFEKMSAEGISQDDWKALNERYQVYSSMIKTSWTITPDVLVVAATNILGIVLVLNFEKLDIVRSKAMSFMMKGRV